MLPGSTRRRWTPSPWMVGMVVAPVAVFTWWCLLPDVTALASKRPATTALIDQRKEEAAQEKRRFRPRQSWLPLERISPTLQAAVVLSEDAGFWRHDGVDWHQLQAAAREDLQSLSFRRGASTITQQLAKNLYYGTKKSLLRKLNELFVAKRLEQALSKRQILSLYLNVIEWGDGVFGADAGARKHFGVSPSQLSAAQAAVMAAMLPAPRRANVKAASPWLRKRSAHVLRLLHATGRLDEAAYRAAKSELDQLFGGASEGPEEIPDDEALPPVPVVPVVPASPSSAAVEPAAATTSPQQEPQPEPSEPIAPTIGEQDPPPHPPESTQPAAEAEEQAPPTSADAPSP